MLDIFPSTKNACQDGSRACFKSGWRLLDSDVKLMVILPNTFEEMTMANFLLDILGF